jgi:hypothetical protein
VAPPGQQWEYTVAYLEMEGKVQIFNDDFCFLLILLFIFVPEVQDLDHALCSSWDEPMASVEKE